MERPSLDVKQSGGLSALVVLAVLFSPLSLAKADHGGCPRVNDLDALRLLQSSPQPSILSVMEPAQRAIILWNGQQQLLFLSTDLKHTTTGVMAEAIPLPASPSARLGSIETFNNLAVLGARYGMSFDDLIPRAPVSKLSNIKVGTVATMKEVFFGNDATAVYSKSDVDYGRILVSKMLSRGYQWVAFDDVTVSDRLQSFPPVEYRFNSTRVFYPMEISVNNQGTTQIDLIVVTLYNLTEFSATDYPINHLGRFIMDSAELGLLSPDWPAFMGSHSVFVEHLRIVGDIRKMSKDLLAR